MYVNDLICLHSPQPTSGKHNTTLMKHLFLACALMSACSLFAQNLPHQWTLDSDAHTLTVGGVEGEDFYDPTQIIIIELQFDQTNWWQQLEDNYESATDISCTAVIDGSTYENVGVRFKGQTSYFTIDGDKKSFNVSLDAFVDGQDHDGYESFNLQNCAYDPSFLREFIYERKIRRHIPAAQCAFVWLYINGEDWGLYPNVQQLNAEFIEEWFQENNGTRWRADSEDSGPGGGGPGGGGPGGGGPGWGDGTAALNWLGADQAEYQEHYTLKTSNIEDPWADLVTTCDVLENTPLDELYAALDPIMDVDRTLWFLASEILFSDDDGYVYKGKMDYYLYFDLESGRMVPLEYDGNTVMDDQNGDWDPFFHADDENYPLLYRLLDVPELRQRYLAHLRVLIEDVMNPETFNPELQEWADMIDGLVNEDPKKLYTYNAFLNDVEGLQEWAEDRYTFLNSYVEVAQDGPQIGTVTMTSPQGEWANPLAEEAVEVTAVVDGAAGAGVSSVMLYYAPTMVSAFTAVEMSAEGNVYSGTIPGVGGGNAVRFYIEAISDNSAGSRSYLPVGAEHDVYIYEVDALWMENSPVVINELMARNSSTAYDEQGQDEDWIELYNTGSEAVNLTGYALTDNPWVLDKWPIPDGTILGADEYLIIWADEDGSDGPFHANFKLDGAGEEVFLIAPGTLIADHVSFGQQEQDMGYARIPNGTGDFEIHSPTFGSNNDYVGIGDLEAQRWVLAPNPASEAIHLYNLPQNTEVRILTASGQEVLHTVLTGQRTLDIAHLASGVYVVMAGTQREVLVVQR